jgi:hypothetical protein
MEAEFATNLVMHFPWQRFAPIIEALNFHRLGTERH